MRKVGRKGIVLIMTMVSICLIFMMMHSVVQSTGLGLANTGSFYDREAALQAAQSGLDYANTRLQDNSGWRGDGNCAYMNNGKYVSYKTFGSFANKFTVSESNGSVVGLIVNNSGYKSAFRIKFNYEKNDTDTYNKVIRSRFGGASSGDNLPYKNFRIAMPYVSVNNLASKVSVLAFRANDNGVGINDSVPNLEGGTVGNPEDAKREFAYHVPPQRVCLIIEGLAGKGLRDCTTTTMVNAAANRGDVLTRRYVEAYYTSNAPVIIGDAAFAKGNIDVDVKNKIYVTTNTKNYTSDATELLDKSTVPASGSLRCAGSSIKIKGKLNTYNGKLVCPDGTSVSITPDNEEYTFLDSEGNPKKYKFLENTVESSSTKVENIDWEDVAQSDINSNNKLAAGLYQWHLAPNSTDKDPKYLLYYYPEYSTDKDGVPQPINKDKFQVAFTSEQQAGKATVIIDNKEVPTMSIGPSNKMQFVTDADGNIIEPTLTMLGNMYCDGNFAIGSDKSTIKKACPKLMIDSYISSEDNGAETAVVNSEMGVLNATGNVLIASSLYGSGAVVTHDGDVTFMGSSVLESGNCGVAIYGKNVNLKSLEGAVSAAPKGAGQGQSLDIDIVTGAAVGSDPTLNADGTRDLCPDQKSFFEFLDNMYKKNDYLDEGKLLDYFANELGADVDFVETHCGILWDDETEKECWGYSLGFYFQSPDNPMKPADDYFYSINVVEGKMRIRQCYPNCNGKYERYNGPVVPSIKVPKDYVVPLNSTSTDTGSNSISDKIANLNLSPTLKDHLKNYGGICYGDQIYGGVIYARENFIADLDDKYSLTVTGAIRAENGDIRIKCRGSQLTYDESYLRKLMPGFNRLTCKLWTCW